MAEDRLIDVVRRERHAVLTLNRPDKMNAVSIAMADALLAALEQLEECPVIVVTGAGRAFCAGVDLSERPAHRRTWRSAFGVSRSQYWADTVSAIRQHPAVFVAAVNGYALGGGLTLVNACELAVASTSAEFGMPELGFGSFPALAGPTSVKSIHRKHVNQMALLPSRVDADTALRFGILNEVVPPDTLLERAEEIASAVAGRDPVALAYTKRGLMAASEMDWASGIEHGALVSAAVQAVRAEADAEQPESTPGEAAH